MVGSLPKQKSASTHQFSMIERPDVRRSRFKMPKRVMNTFDAGYLVPIYLQEVLPGDDISMSVRSLIRMTTPIFPVMDNLYATIDFWFVPNRLVWINWVRMQGEQDNPADSISYSMPQVTSPAGGYPIGSLFDHYGLPTVGQVAGGNTVTHSVIPLRGYNYIWNQWYRDENLQNSLNISSAGITNPGDGPDANNLYSLQRRGKRGDYFTTALPFLQKGTAVGLPLGVTAPVMINASIATGNSVKAGVYGTANARQIVSQAAGTGTTWGALAANTTDFVADLAGATASTVNQLRQAIAIQQVLEKDARGGTRYVEINWNYFGVRSPDARLNRPEFLGGGEFAINVAPVPQTSGTSASGTTTPMGTLAGVAIGKSAGNGFRAAFVEHGYIHGFISVRAELTYQQGLARHWSKKTRYDFFLPPFEGLGEQAILNKEIYVDGSANDDLVFGYQARWDEYRYNNSEIHGLFRSTAAGTLDGWHMAQKFTSLPTLNSTFIQDTPPLSRVLAVGAAANGAQFYGDFMFDVVAERPIPLYGVPGLRRF